MKRWLSHATIAVYLAALSWGIVGHSLKVGTGVHPVMYFLVWDMFCGWSAWASKIHIVGEGASGRYYELAPPPWGDLHPFGSFDRQDYDANSTFAGRMAINCLRHTRHEPIVRIFAVEEAWAKKFNLPDELWALRYNRPKDIQKYYRVRHVLTGDGQLVHTATPWAVYQASLCLADNPRLKAETRKGSSLYAFGGGTHPFGTESHSRLSNSSGGRYGLASPADSPAGLTLGWPNGN